MGELMRSTDWSRTVFGPVEQWPQSLRTAVSIMLESRFAIVVAWGPDFRFFYNDGYKPILGSKHPMALGTPGEVIFPEVWPVVGPEFERVRRGESFAIEDWLLPLERNGYLENCWFTLSYSPIRDESGAVGGLLAIVAETTGRVEGERRLATLRDLARRAADAKTAEDACRNAARVFEQDRMDVPFALFYLADKAARRAGLVGSVGFDLESEATPRTVDLGAANQNTGWPLAGVMARGEPLVLDDLPGRFGRLPGGDCPESTHTAVLLPLSRPGLDHPYGVLVAGVSPRRALDDRYRGFFDLAADHISTAVSNARAFEAERQRAEALAQIDRAKTAFFSNVSHEFRTPLTLLLGPTEDALRQPRPALVGENLQTVHRNALRLLKLVNSLLDFSRIEAGRVQASYQPTNLQAFTQDLVSGFRSAVERGGLNLIFQAPDELPEAWVDRSMWEKIVLNLLSNAFKFTFEGRITVTLRTQGDQIDLSVEDTGVGIPGAEIPRLFERFHRVSGTPSRTYEGSGIGLALVQELVRLHGGSIQVQSEVEKGSTFTVRIPLGSNHLPPDRLRDDDSGASTAIGVAPFGEEARLWIEDDQAVEPVRSEAAGSGRILVADDNADMRSYLTRILGAHWSVESVADGAAALQAARAHKPDVVLTDIMMPGLDGFELLRALRRDGATQDVRVIMLSARAGEESRLEGLDAGADDYLVKPFSARELVARVQAQVTIARAQVKISDHRNELYSLFMQAPAPICVLRGCDLRYEMANPLYLKVAGRSNIVGKTVYEALPELTGQGFDRLILDVMRTGQPHIAHENLVRYDRGNGMEDTWFNFIYAPLENPDGSVERVMVFCYEVTDQVMARRESDIARRQAEAAARAKDEFLAMLGHELRNPLAPIVTALDLMKQKGNDALEMERAVIDRQVRYMVRLVDDLLDVARIARGKIELQKKPVEFSTVIASGLDVARPMIEARSQSLSLDVPATGMLVHADEVRMAQVIANLLTNASKFTPTGGHIAIQAQAREGLALLWVRDNGRGISAELLPRIFEVFEQGERSNDELRAGLGLGLTIVKSLTELHDGQVSVRSEGMGQGSEFEISLPLIQGLPTEIADFSEETQGREPPSGKRILVVDDNKDGAGILALALEMVGHEVQVAYDGRSALELAAEFEPDVVLLDLGLPILSGYEVARRLRAARSLASEAKPLRIIAVSGYGQESDQNRSAQAGCDLHLVKPVDLEALTSILG